MLDFTYSDLKATAERLLNRAPDPIPRLRLARDVLRLDADSAEFLAAQAGVGLSKWVALLEATQQPDGTWGRFHSQDSRLKQPFPTTENAITAALDAGLDRTSPLLARTMIPLMAFVQGAQIWSDRPEKHDNPLAWAVWVRQFSAAVLAQIDRFDPHLDEFFAVWAEAVSAVFQSGVYDRQAEIRALNRLLECRMKDPVPYHRKYPLLILSCGRRSLPPALEDRLLEHVMHYPAGIYYVCDQPISQMPAIRSRGFWQWCQAVKLLSRFPRWKHHAAEAANWLWAQRGEDGLWDFGSAVPRRPFSSLPLSESWRQVEKRVMDSSVEALSLLARCVD